MPAETGHMAEAARYSAADNIELLQGMAIVMHGVKTSDECDERLLSLELIEPVGNDGDMRLTEKGAKTLSAWRRFIDDFGKSA